MASEIKMKEEVEEQGVDKAVVLIQKGDEALPKVLEMMLKQDWMSDHDAMLCSWARGTIGVRTRWCSVGSVRKEALLAPAAPCRCPSVGMNDANRDEVVQR